MDTQTLPGGVRRDLFAGTLLIVAGGSVAWEAAHYGFGTLARMGPGLFPCLLGSALALVGVLIALTRGGGGEADDHDPAAGTAPDWRGWACIIGGVALFILLGEHAGLGPATFACVSALGDRMATWRSALVLALVCALIAAVVFSALLHFQMPLLRW